MAPLHIANTMTGLKQAILVTMRGTVHDSGMFLKSVQFWIIKISLFGWWLTRSECMQCKIHYDPTAMMWYISETMIWEMKEKVNTHWGVSSSIIGVFRFGKSSPN